ncbi:MAG: hypothetical protein ABFR75_07250 [Acidobacteriota bacterium]
MNDEIKQLNEKVDFLTEQVLSLTSRLKSVDDFKEDMSLFAKDAFDEVVTFMNDVDFHFRSEDFLCLIKKSFRNIRNFTKLLDQLQSFVEFVEDLSPLAKEIFNDITDKIYELEKKGTLESIRRTVGIIDNLSENFEPEDVTNFGNAMVIFLGIAKKLALPENLDKIQNIVDDIDKYEYDNSKKVSLFKLFKKIRNQEVLKGADMALDYAKIASKYYTKNK